MKSLRAWFLTVATLLPSSGCAHPVFSRNGHETPGGGPTITYEYNPWFIGKSRATFCVEKSDQFSEPRDAAIAEVKLAFRDWEDALDELAIAPLPKPLVDGICADSAAHRCKDMTRRFEYSPTCSEDTDIRVLLGVFLPQVRDVVGTPSVGYIALSQRTTYVDDASFSKGYIWLRPDRGPDAYDHDNPGTESFWYLGRHTHDVLVHEIGHILGLTHESGGFMTEAFVHDVALNATKRRPAPQGARPRFFVDRQLGGKSGTVCHVMTPKDWGPEDAAFFSKALGFGPEADGSARQTTVFLRRDPSRELGDFELSIHRFGEAERSITLKKTEHPGDPAALAEIPLATGRYRYFSSIQRSIHVFYGAIEGSSWLSARDSRGGSREFKLDVGTGIRLMGAEGGVLRSLTIPFKSVSGENNL